jgi:ribosome maturation factor RimP
MIDREKIKDLVLSEINKHEIVLVDIQVKSGNLIKILLDSFSGVSIDDCVRISKLIESNFDRDIEDYELEVSSYGISLAFKIPLHYEKNIDKQVEVYLKNGRIIRGILKKYKFEDENISEIGILLKKKVQLEGKKRKTEIEEINNFLSVEIQKVMLLLDF